MFEEFIAHGNEMIRRLERLVGLSYEQLKARPDHEQVAVIESQAWMKAVRKKILSAFGKDTAARYDLISELWSDEISRQAGSEIGRSLNFKRRIVALMNELDTRSNQRSPPNRRPNRLPQTSRKDAQAAAPRIYDLFISHASEDKESIARPLYNALMAMGLSVWFDEATLELGDSLRRKIDAGLIRCRYGVVILSPRFLGKEWPQRELDGLIARETATGEKALLPVWHELNSSTLAQYSPTLADRLAVRSDEGIPTIVEKILHVLGR